MSNQKVTLKGRIAQRREELAATIYSPLQALSGECVTLWGDRQALEEKLCSAIGSIPLCKYLYIFDSEGQQLVSTISQQGLLEDDFGRDRSQRPYMLELTPGVEYLLSDAYTSLRVRRPSITAMHTIRNDNRALLGYLGVDFDLRDVPLGLELYEESTQWRQVRGDPSIRRHLFQQERVESEMDRDIEDVMGLMEELIVDHGIFQLVLHFSSSRATVWHIQDPFRYRLLDVDMLTDPDTCLAYPKSAYPEGAEVPANRVRGVLDGYQELRQVDETIYLRSASFNIFNGLVSLTFSCDGSHYLQYGEFLDRRHAFWTDTR